MANVPQKQIRVLIVDDHHLVRMGLCALIEGQPEMTVVGEAVNCAEALSLTGSARPDLILLDIDLGNENGLDFLVELRALDTQIRVLILTEIKDPATHRRAAKLGAAGLVLKDQPTDVLLKAIKKVHEGEAWLDRSLMGSLLSELTRTDKKVDSEEARLENLTAREREVISLIAEGLKNKQIAARLFISETTVTHHLSSIFSKLGVSDRLELVIYAFSYSLAKMPKRLS
jgi:two-component system, NarL family, nitrate/nitrite response regulator NarL